MIVLKIIIGIREVAKIGILVFLTLTYQQTPVRIRLGFFVGLGLLGVPLLVGIFMVS